MTTNQANQAATQYFLPGENLVIRPEWRRRACPGYERASVHGPGRLHITVFDYSKMAPGMGGGGLGISTATVSNEVVVSKDQRSSKAQSVPTAQHLLYLFKQLVGYEGDDLYVAVPERIQHAHGGFGSNVSFNTAVIAGLNALFGSPFSVGEMWRILTQNFVENTADGEQTVYTGLDTGVGEACLLYGGLVWIDEGEGFGDGRYVGSASADNLWVVTGAGIVEKLASEMLLALGKGVAGGPSDKIETDLVASMCQEYQRNYGAALKKLLDRRLRPALLRNDLRGLLSYGWELNSVGNVKVLEGLYRPDVLKDLTDSMRKEGALYAGMSSAGPGFFAFALSEGDAHKLRTVLEARFGEYFGAFAVGRAGTKLSVNLEA